VVFDGNGSEITTLLTDTITDNGSSFTLNNFPTEWIVHRYWSPLPNTYKLQIFCTDPQQQGSDWVDLVDWIIDDYISCEFAAGPQPSWWMTESFQFSYENICCQDGRNMNAGGTPPNQGNEEGSTFSATIDNEWTNMGNWDDGTKMALPSASATIAGSVYSSSIDNISLNTLTVTGGGIGVTINIEASVTMNGGSLVDSAFNPVCGKEGTFSCQGYTTVLISGSSIIDGGTITGADIVTFDTAATIQTNGLITNVQTVFFNDGSGAYACQIDGRASFNDTSGCFGAIKAVSIDFNDSALNYATLTGGDNITEDIVFNNTSSNTFGGIINGHYNAPLSCLITNNTGFKSDFMNSSYNLNTVQRVVFNDTSYNTGTVTESLFQNSSYSNGGTVTSSVFCDSAYNDNGSTSTTCNFYGNSYNNGTADTCNFYDTSQNRATANNCTFEDSSNNTSTGTVNIGTFKETSYNSGNATDVNFEDSAYNNTGGVTDIARFYDTAENRGTCNTNSSIDTEFHDCSKNKGTCINNAKFYNAAINHSSGTIGGGFFYDSSINMGTVSGGAQFNSSVSPPRCCNNGTLLQSATFSGTSFNNGTAALSATYNGYTGYIASFTSDCGDSITVDAYFIGGQKTTLDSSGNGCWNNYEYTNGSITGSC
jgi:hypothetical protein